MKNSTFTVASEDSTAATAVLTDVLDFKKLLLPGLGDFKKGLTGGSRRGFVGLWEGEFSSWLPQEPRFNVVEPNMAAKNQLLLSEEREKVQL